MKKMETETDLYFKTLNLSEQNRNVLQTKDWICTIFQYTEEQIQNLKRITENDKVNYLVFSKEICPETKRKHLHVFVQMQERCRRSTVQELLMFNGDCRGRRGTVQECIDYVRKTGKFAGKADCQDEESTEQWWEGGMIQGQGKRNDLREMIQEINTLQDFKSQEPMMFCKYRNGLKEIYGDKEQKNALMFKPEVWWLSGPTGCGKTRSAIEKFPEACVLHCNRNMWFDEYDGSETVILDEFRWDSIEYQTILAMTTYNRGLKLKIKGAFVWFHPRRIIFTSPETPEIEYSFRGQDEKQTLRSDYVQLKRRIDFEVAWIDKVTGWVKTSRATEQEKSILLFDFEHK